MFNFVSTTYLRLSLLSVLILLSASSFTLSASETVEQYKLKAALIYKMGTYLSWKLPKKRMNYCFIGPNSYEVGKLLKERKEIGKLKVDIRVSSINHLTVAAVKNCDLLYVDENQEVEKDQLTAISKSTFTITSSHKALNKGYIASIEMKQNKHFLSVSKNNLKKSEISVNSRLLSFVNLK